MLAVTLGYVGAAYLLVMLAVRGWVMRDADRLGLNGLRWFLLCTFLPLFGLTLYLMLRPYRTPEVVIADRYRRRYLGQSGWRPARACLTQVRRWLSAPAET